MVTQRQEWLVVNQVIAEITEVKLNVNLKAAIYVLKIIGTAQSIVVL